jgi:hypothetical protein
LESILGLLKSLKIPSLEGVEERQERLDCKLNEVADDQD